MTSATATSIKGHFYKTTVMRALLYGAIFWATKKQEVEVYVGL